MAFFLSPSGRRKGSPTATALRITTDTRWPQEVGQHMLPWTPVTLAGLPALARVSLVAFKVAPVGHLSPLPDRDAKEANTKYCLSDFLEKDIFAIVLRLLRQDSSQMLFSLSYCAILPPRAVRNNFRLLGAHRKGKTTPHPYRGRNKIKSVS